MRRSYFPQILTWLLLATLVGITIIKFYRPIPPIRAFRVMLNDHRI